MSVIPPFEVYTLIGKFLFENRIARIICLIIFFLSVLGTLGLFIYSRYYIIGDLEKDDFQKQFFPAVIIPALIITVFYVLHLTPSSLNVLEAQLESIREERKSITNKIEVEAKLDIFHTIQLSLNQLSEYYTINKGQARMSFRMSIGAIVIGLLTITAGILLFYSGKKEITLAYISGIAGVILEFVGGAYFFMYKKSLEQVNLFFGQLIKVQDTMLAINLANDMSNEDRKNDMTEKIVVSLLERSLK